MNLKEIRELIEFLKEQEIAEFELERGDVKVRIKRDAAAPPAAPQYVMAAPAVATASPPVPAAEAPTAPKEPAKEEGLHIVRSPIVGTFYEAPSPGAPPFVKPGDIVTAGQVLCIVEAMKLMNEIESDVAGEIVKRLVNNGAAIEYSQPLFEVRPRS
jgi:acetyl-CoA carboxylase biotin carboxyl carrier protein